MFWKKLWRAKRTTIHSDEEANHFDITLYHYSEKAKRARTAANREMWQERYEARLAEIAEENHS
jgi:hypothetical protein